MHLVHLMSLSSATLTVVEVDGVTGGVGGVMVNVCSLMNHLVSLSCARLALSPALMGDPNRRPMCSKFNINHACV